MNEVVIVSAVRTPIGAIRGALSTVRPDDLAGLVIASAVARASIDPAEIEEVIFGCANQAGEDNRNVARMGLLLAGLPQRVAGITVNRLCASGLSAINQAARAIACGDGDVYVAGGVESMTRAPYALPKHATGFGQGNQTAFDTTLGWRFPNPKMQALFPLEPMGETAENIHQQSLSGNLKGGEITRQMQDEFALNSQIKAVTAMQNGYFKPEIVPVPIVGRKGTTLFDTDEYPRARQTETGFEVSTDMQQLSALKAAFRPNGTVTAGNSSGLNDGAAALVLMSAKKAESLGIKPLARWCAGAASGVDPRLMGLGPVAAVPKALARADIKSSDLDLVELNEAFAVQALAVLHELELPEEICNVNGGAIALGHPLGASGARIVTSLIFELQRRAALGQTARYGLATLCVGVGQGEAAIFERLT
jgi:acetyl-CoA acetyltransferase family protein